MADDQEQRPGVGRRVKVTGDLFHGRVPDGAVYIGRAAPGLPASPYANPYPVSRYGLTVSLRLYTEHIQAHPELVRQARADIGTRDVACWCAPAAACHGDPLLAAMADRAAFPEVSARQEPPVREGTSRP